MEYRISYWCVSHIGKVRSVNQDNFICDGRYLQPDDEPMDAPLVGTLSSLNPALLGVFDGMGGEECGEVAAYIAAKNAAEVKLGAQPLDDLSNYCQATNDDICREIEQQGISSMGTTAAILAFDSEGITLCNIGDSKILRFSKNGPEQISMDHVAVCPFGKKPPLSQNLGIPSTEMLIDPYFARGVYRDGDFYLICSDGLTDMVSPERIQKALYAARNPEAAAQEMLRTALLNGGKDNITFILCRIEKVRRGLGRLFATRH